MKTRLSDGDLVVLATTLPSPLSVVVSTAKSASAIFHQQIFTESSTLKTRQGTSPHIGLSAGKVQNFQMEITPVFG